MQEDSVGTMIARGVVLGDKKGVHVRLTGTRYLGRNVLVHLVNAVQGDAWTLGATDSGEQLGPCASGPRQGEVEIVQDSVLDIGVINVQGQIQPGTLVSDAISLFSSQQMVKRQQIKKWGKAFSGAQEFGASKSINWENWVG